MKTFIIIVLTLAFSYLFVAFVMWDILWFNPRVWDSGIRFLVVVIIIGISMLGYGISCMFEDTTIR